MTKRKQTDLDHLESGILLPRGYQPSQYTVIVGHGKEPKTNQGNKRLRVLAQSFLQRYQYGDKKCKTVIVSEIIRMVRAVRGAFVKHAKNGRWYKLDDMVAREKVGYVFRDLLADQYTSSSKSKVARRRFIEQQGKSTQPLQRYFAPFNAMINMDATHQIQSNPLVQQQRGNIMGNCYSASAAPAVDTGVSYSNYKTEKQSSVSQPMSISVEEISDMMIRSGAFLDEKADTSKTPPPPSEKRTTNFCSASTAGVTHNGIEQQSFSNRHDTTISMKEIADILKCSGICLNDEQSKTSKPLPPPSSSYTTTAATMISSNSYYQNHKRHKQSSFSRPRISLDEVSDVLVRSGASFLGVDELTPLKESSSKIDKNLFLSFHDDKANISSTTHDAGFASFDETKEVYPTKSSPSPMTSCYHHEDKSSSSQQNDIAVEEQQVSDIGAALDLSRTFWDDRELESLENSLFDKNTEKDNDASLSYCQEKDRPQFDCDALLRMPLLSDYGVVFPDSQHLPVP